MKKLMMMAVALVISVTAFAQAGQMAVGLNGSYGIKKDYNRFGIGAKFQYEMIDNFRAEVSGNYFLPKEDTYSWDLNLNFHYTILVGESVKVYPLVGVTYLNHGLSGDAKKAVEAVDGKTSDGKVGFNAGAGIEYYVSSNFKINAECKYQYVKDMDWVVPSIGFSYVF